MKFEQFNIDDNLREYFEYKDESFPFAVWTDFFDTLFERTLPCHWHDSFEIGIVVSGKLDYYIDGECYPLHQGDCVFVNSNILHMAKQTEINETVIMFVITFRPSLFAHTTDSLIYQKYIQPILDSPVKGFKINTASQRGKEVINGMNQIYSLNCDQYGYELQCLSLISQVWYNLIGCVSEYSALPHIRNRHIKHSNVIKYILSFIHTHYRENISIDDIADHASISRSECFRCFQRFTNKTPVEYINEYRLTHAAMMLKESEQTVTEICTACGFSNPSYFGKLFKEKYALTPLQYRRSKI